MQPNITAKKPRHFAHGCDFERTRSTRRISSFCARFQQRRELIRICPPARRSSTPSPTKPQCDAAKNGENYARWCNKEFQDLIDKARAIAEPAQRAALYEQAMDVFDKDQPWIPMAYPKMFTAMRKNVEGYTQSPLTNNNFATTQVK
jgi:hypothetical protein